MGEGLPEVMSLWEVCVHVCMCVLKVECSTLDDDIYEWYIGTLIIDDCVCHYVGSLKGNHGL